MIYFFWISPHGDAVIPLQTALGGIGGYQNQVLFFILKEKYFFSSGLKKLLKSKSPNAPQLVFVAELQGFVGVISEKRNAPSEIRKIKFYVVITRNRWGDIQNWNQLSKSPQQNVDLKGSFMYEDLC